VGEKKVLLNNGHGVDGGGADNRGRETGEGQITGEER